MCKIIWVLIVATLGSPVGGLVCLPLGMVGLVQAEETEKPIAEPEGTAISELIKQLGDKDFKIREAAQKELTKLGEKLIEQYRQTKSDADKKKIVELANVLRQACQNRDAEIKTKANQIRLHFYNRTQAKIAFISERDGNPELYVMDADGQNQTNLTKDPGGDESPVWSPDGTKIAFESSRDYLKQIYIIDADGETQKPLTKSDNVAYSIAWSPDGKRIAFTSGRDRNWEIYVMDADGRNQRNLTKNKEDDQDPVWSPDGTKIAFESMRHDAHEIYVMDADGKNQRQLTRIGGNNKSTVWSPDGTTIAFASNRDDCIGVYIMDAAGKNQKRLMEKYSCAPTWSSDGTKIAFETRRHIGLMDADGKNQIELAKGNDPVWSPDGTKIVFYSGAYGNYEIYVMDADGRNQKQLTKNKANDVSPAWSPVSLPEIAVLFADKEQNKDK